VEPVLSISTENRSSPVWLGLAAAGAFGAAALGLFGLPPVDLHGPLHRQGIMDPFCGGTRATAALARGQLTVAWRYNPGVIFLALAVVAIIVRAVAGLTTGRWLRLSLGRRTWIGVLLLGLIALEINQQVHATLLQ